MNSQNRINCSHMVFSYENYFVPAINSTDVLPITLFYLKTPKVKKNHFQKLTCPGVRALAGFTSVTHTLPSWFRVSTQGTEGENPNICHSVLRFPQKQKQLPSLS